MAAGILVLVDGRDIPESPVAILGQRRQVSLTFAVLGQQTYTLYVLYARRPLAVLAQVGTAI
jgi:hypothetical protein